jgi:hypothetical protein
MNNYTNNGIAGLAAYGRGNDTELVHMTPGEVKGLQALAMAHGGSLTVNPNTGLVEAGFLEDILPVVAAAGLTYMTAGAAAPYLAGTLGATGAGIVAGAGAGAVISGGFAAAQGKDVGQAALMGGLGGAISGGLGAYGDAGTFAADAAKTGTQAAVPAGTQAATNAGVNAAGNTVSMANTAGTGFINPETGQAITQSLYPNATQAGMNAAALPEGAARNAALEQLAQNTGTLAEGSAQLPGQGIANTPTSASSYYSGLKPDQYIQKAGIQALPAAGLLENEQNLPGGQQEDEYTRRLKGYRLSPNYKPYEAPRPNPYYRPSYAAEGGVMESFDDEAGSDTVGMARGGVATDNDPDTRYQDALTAAMTRLNKAGKTAGIKASPLPKTSIKGLGDISGAYPRQAAGGGIMSNLGGYSDGGRMLKGPGDGMSDSIPGVIGGKQPARLADGEFVVPADVVSHLGNGSTDAGAKKLYNMMDNIRKARTGKKKQAPQVNVDKYLPGKKKASGGITGYAEGGVAEGGTVGYAEGGLATTIQNAYNAGYSGSQIGAALIAEGVTQAQAAAATGLSADVIAQVYAGGAAWNDSGKPIGDPEGPARNTAATTTSATNSGAGNTGTVGGSIGAAIDTRTTGPGGYTIPTFSDVNVAGYLRDNNITSQAQIDQVSRIFNVSADQIARAQALIAANDPRIAEGTAQYVKDIAANPAQLAQNERDVRARMEQLGLTGPIIPPLVPVKPVTDESTATTGPIAGSAVYRPGFVPRTTGLNVSDAAKDPYSNAGLESLYSQMMNQYNKPTGIMSDVAVKALAENAYKSGSGAEVGRALINAGIPVNQAITALKSYSGLTPDIVNQAYIGGQALGTTPPPTLNTQYNYSDPGTFYRPPSPNNLILTKPIVDAAFTPPAPTPANTGFFTAPNGQIFSSEAAYTASVPVAQGSKAGGLMSIKHKKRRA